MPAPRWRWTAAAPPTLRTLTNKLRQRATLHAQLATHFATTQHDQAAFLADADAQAALKQLKALDALVVGGKLETDAMPAAKVATAYAKDPLGVGRARVVPLGLRLKRPEAFARLLCEGGWRGRAVGGAKAGAVATPRARPRAAAATADDDHNTVTVTQRLYDDDHDTVAVTQRLYDDDHNTVTVTQRLYDDDHDTVAVTQRLYHKGYTVARIAALRALSEGSVHRHLLECYPHDARVQLPDVVDVRRVLPVYAVLVGCGTDLPMRRVRERVVAAGHAAVSYTDVQWVRAYVWARFWDFGVRGEEEEDEEEKKRFDEHSLR
jgi:hypothetical protein